MKKLILVLALMTSFILPTNEARAGFFESDWFEPTLLCAAAGGTGYLVASEGDELLYAGVGCAAGAVLGVLINSRYKNKYGEVYQEEIQDLKRAVREMEASQAQRSARGEEDGGYSIKIQEIVPGKKLPNGDILAPSIRERLVIPGEGTRIGE